MFKIGGFSIFLQIVSRPMNLFSSNFLGRKTKQCQLIFFSEEKMQGVKLMREAL